MPLTINTRVAGVQFYSPHRPSEDYTRLLWGARAFFRNNSDRRYSGNTHNLIEMAAQQLRSPGISESPMPFMVVKDSPIVLDQLTEIKTGGTTGMILSWPNRTIVAVRASARRQGLGSTLLSLLQAELGASAVVLWVGRENTPGHQFALRSGLLPAAMNSSGAVRYDFGGEDN